MAFMKKENYPKNKLIAIAIMLLSAIVRGYYVSYITVYKNQYDGGEPYSLGGQLGYITWYLTKRRLPDFDVSKVDQFWHPPLHYFLSAEFLRVVWKLFPSQYDNFELLQILPFVYITVTIFLIWKILLFFNKEENSLELNAVLAFVALQPGLVIRSATINNDSLVLLMMTIIIYLALLWHKYGKWWQIISLAISFGLGLMSKKSAAITAIPLLVLGMDKLIRSIHEKNWIKMRQVLSQAGIFLIIAAPLGLWWYVRNYVLYDVSFNFFWNIEKGWEYEEYLGNMSVAKRLLGFDLGAFSYANTYLQYKKNSLQDYNPLVALLKTAVSDVWSWTYVDGRHKKLSYIMLVLRSVLTLAGVVSIPAFIRHGCIADSNQSDNNGAGTSTIKALFNTVQNLAMIAFYVALLVSYYVFCFDYPYVWTMDYKYIEAIVICEALFLLTWLNRNDSRKRKSMYLITMILIAAFCAASGLFFVVAKELF